VPSYDSGKEKLCKFNPRMSVSSIRRIACWLLLLVVPSSLSAQTPAAILRTQGGVYVNGTEAPDSSAIFAGDLLETRPGFSANLTLDGSTILLQAESVAKFEQDVLVLDHGSVSVGTSKSFKVRVNCITVIPVVNEWTQYDVTDLNGTVQVLANKKDVNVDHAGNHANKPAPESETGRSASVHEGQHENYNESDVCGAPARPTGAGSGLSPKWIAAGVGGGAGLLLLLLLHGGGKPPMSPSSP
jgi:hypothetical protein